jgi:2-polyprenyl-6-methoxyphenol hydroxylase-like FAD-dependent oxidoreductase
MLDIHDYNGQVALRTAGLFEQFRGIIHAGGQAMRILDKHNIMHVEEDDEGDGSRPEVDRGQLRRLLLDSLPHDTIRWGMKALGARPLGDGRHELSFADGSTVTTDVLVGADGAWSRIRPLVSDAKPAYSGVSFVEVDLFDADAHHPGPAAVIGAGMLFALSAGKGFLVHKEADGSLHIYIAFKTTKEWISSVDFAGTDKAKAILLEQFADWSPELRSLITEADGALIPRTINVLPIGHRWDRAPGLTLLGDAAHLMSPFAGEGANLAMLDGAELGQAIAEHPGDVETALAAYEQALFPRSADAAQEAATNRDLLQRQRPTQPHRPVRRLRARPVTRLPPVTPRKPAPHDRCPYRDSAAPPARPRPHRTRGRARQDRADPARRRRTGQHQHAARPHLRRPPGAGPGPSRLGRHRTPRRPRQRHRPGRHLPRPARPSCGDRSNRLAVTGATVIGTSFGGWVPPRWQ